MISDTDLTDLAHALKTNPGHVVPNGTMLGIVLNLLEQRQVTRRLQGDLSRAASLSMFDVEEPPKRQTRSGR